MWDYRARVIEVHDGDTLTAKLDLGFRLALDVTVRLVGVYAPELKDEGGQDTLNYVQQWCADVEKASGYVPWPFKVTTIRLKNDSKELKTLDRYVCLVTNLSGTRSLNIEVELYVDEKGYGGGVGAKYLKDLKVQNV